LDPTLTEFSQILTELYSVLPNALSPPTLVPAAG
jgi:primosomal protein N'